MSGMAGRGDLARQVSGFEGTREQRAVQLEMSVRNSRTENPFLCAMAFRRGVPRWKRSLGKVGLFPNVNLAYRVAEKVVDEYLDDYFSED